jgi:hypothetical protein
MYDSKSPTSLIKKTVSPLGRKLYDDPVSKGARGHSMKEGEKTLATPQISEIAHSR